MTYFVGMTHNREFDFWECNFVRSDETEAREELKRLHGKACYQIQLFRMEEVPGTRSEFFEGAAVQPAAAPGNLADRLAREEREHDQTLQERDNAEKMADDLAAAIASITGDDMGEHSSANCPWQNALDSAEAFVARHTDKPGAVQWFCERHGVFAGPVCTSCDAEVVRAADKSNEG
jgi:hypothetical protein